MKYKKKPIIIEACQYKELLYDLEAYKALPSWMKLARGVGSLYYNTKGQLIIKTPGGEHVVNKGDYIIRGAQNELYPPCNPDVFEMIYEKHIPVADNLEGGEVDEE